MGVRIRKSKNVGPLRFNLSKSGIGVSYGVKGARVTKTAKGTSRTTLSIPGTGIYYVTETPSKKSKKTKQKYVKNNSLNNQNNKLSFAQKRAKGTISSGNTLASKYVFLLVSIILIVLDLLLLMLFSDNTIADIVILLIFAAIVFYVRMFKNYNKIKYWINIYQSNQDDQE